MPKLINRAPQTPRKIRDIRPKRQLARNSEKKDEQHDDDWWYRANNNGGVGQAHQRGAAAATLTRSGIISSDTNAPRATTESNIQEDGGVPRRGIFCICHTIFCMCNALIKIYRKIRQAPRQKRRKRFFWALVLLLVWRIIYSADLDQYSFSDLNGSVKRSSSDPYVTIKSIDSEYSSLKAISDDALMIGDTVGSQLADTRLRGSGISASNANDMLKRTTSGLKFVSHSVTESLSPQKKPRSMAESLEIGSDDFGASHGSSNSLQSHGSNGFGTDVFGASRRNSNSLLSQSSGLLASNSFETKTSQVGGMQSPMSLTNPQAQNSFANDRSQGLRGQNLLGSPQSMLGNGHDSNGIQSPSEYHHSNGKRDDDFSMEKDRSFQDASKRSASFQDGIRIEANSPSSNSHKQLSDYQNNPITNQNGSPHKLASGSAAGLECSVYGGPYDQSEYAEIVYWRDIPTDASFISPYYNPQAQEAISGSFWKAKYLTFEMDDAGWNNVRLGLENVMLLAHSMGRTLVIPPRQQIAHGMMDGSGSNQVAFSDYFDIEGIGAKQKGLIIITMEQFLQREGLQGNLRSYFDGESEVLYPPNNRIKWDNQPLDPLWKYIRNVTKTFQWNPNECVLAFPAAGTDDQHLFSMMADVLVGKDGRPFPHYSEYQGRPVNVDAPTIERFREILAGRRKICMYDQKIHEDNPVVHFKADKYDGTRLITQFYAFLWFEDWRHDVWSKRFIRDNLRYRDEIMCLAARIINAMRDRAKKNGRGNVNGLYDAIHIRRGDFQQQYPSTEMNASEILTGLKEFITPGASVFIATNERDLSFFASIQEVYDVSFIGDFGHIVSGVNPNYFPLVEQIVASRGRIFIGTFLSTFSAYIARLRGYYGVKELHHGYMTGGLQNTYYLPSKWKKEFRLYQAVHKPLFGRDFPVAWRDIDRLELPTS